MPLNPNRYELHKKHILIYRIKHKDKYNAYMKEKNKEYYYKRRYGCKAKRDEDKIICDIHRLFKRPYNKKLK